ncbi:MAG: [FeFe] hydrogenase H-cluster maturation GTPase HydF [Oscillospiraceae bacterium]|nr:[FeFe] hydrogenase H-cluster maturation GTPase HydF [Oscillospiraceae bacterium]
MSLNDTVSAERVHIGFFGLRNAGKSSVVNAVTGQELAVVSDVKGTTTDPVRKAMELLPLGPVVIIDTPGIDDEGTLGEMRVKKARQVLNYTDIAVLVTDATKELSVTEKQLVELFGDKKIPYVVASNKSDLLESVPQGTENTIYISAKQNKNIYELKEMLARLVKDTESDKRIVADLIDEGDAVVLVVPIDSAAPKGRLILPQQQTIRDILETGGTSVVCRESELVNTLSMLSKKPKLIITDSQVFGKVSKDTPSDILLTSFSILFARFKGNLENAVKGAAQLDRLRDGDTVLISEGCTHHRQCDDIGTVKMPKWIENYTGKKLNFEFTSGREFPDDLLKYALVVHCGGCMLNEREMQYRARHSADCGVPMTNYGIAIAQMHGILKRSLEPFSEIKKLLDR